MVCVRVSQPPWPHKQTSAHGLVSFIFSMYVFLLVALGAMGHECL